MFGLWFFSVPRLQPFFGETAFFTTLIYGYYTIAFGLFTLSFAAALWVKKTVGLVGTIVVCVFVIIADSLTLLNLPSIPGIPKFAAIMEIPYSVIVVLYLLQPNVRTSLMVPRRPD
jgi:hypothetical protein